MNKNPSQILTNVLNIIGYDEDKQKFVKSFLELCITKASVDIIESLPIDQKDKMSLEIKKITNADDTPAIYKKYITKPQYDRYLEIASSELFENYIESILPSLAPITKTKLLDYLKTL